MLQYSALRTIFCTPNFTTCATGDWSLIQVIACARLFRLFRLLNIYKPYHDLAKITWFLLPKALDVFMILAIMCYLFSAIGVSLFGGLIDNHPSSPTLGLQTKTWGLPKFRGLFWGVPATGIIIQWGLFWVPHFGKRSPSFLVMFHSPGFKAQAAPPPYSGSKAQDKRAF